VLLLVVVGSLWSAPAQAEDITGTVQRVGWWTKRLGAQPTVPPASFEVAIGTDKAATSVAAIDISLPVVPVQTLQISLTELAGTTGQVASIAHIQVCLAAPGWSTANGGAFGQGPAIDCSSGAADLTRSLDGNWLGDIGGLVPNGGTASLGVVLVDDLAQPISPGATVQISTIAIEGQSAEGVVPDASTTVPVVPPGTDGSIIDPSGGFVPPAAGSIDLPPVETPTGEAPASTTTTAPPAPVDEFGAPVAFDTDPTPWWRLVVLVPLALGMGFAAVFARRELERRGLSFG
jgi:hypothetical protein